MVFSMLLLLGFTVNSDNKYKQDCIPVGCVPPARRPYLPACCGPGGVPVPGGCTWSGYLVPGGVPGPGGVYLVPGGTWSGGCTWSRGVYLVWGVYLVPGVYLVLGGCAWSQGVYLVPGGVPGQVLPHCEQNHTHL